MPLASVTHTITSFVGDHGIYAVFVLMAVDAVFPAASELVMVYAGALAGGAFAGSRSSSSATRSTRSSGLTSPSSLAGTLGYLVGSLIGWAIGAYGGRPLLERHGRWLHLSPENFAPRRALVRAPRRRCAVFLGRLTPLVRSFISIPAGVFRCAARPLHAADPAGSAIWCFALRRRSAGVSERSYRRVHEDFRFVDYAVIVAVCLARGAGSCTASVSRRRTVPHDPAR